MIWDVNVLIAWISSHPPRRDNHFDVSRHVAILLLLASGRRVHDLTLLRTSANHLQDQEDCMIFWPVFGSKTDSTSHNQSGWLLSQQF